METVSGAQWKADYRFTYPSSREPGLQLAADVFLPGKPAPLLLLLHGWHQSRSDFRSYAELLAERYVVVNVDMRGRGRCAGRPDVNGWELLDAVDAISHVKQSYAEHINDPHSVYCLGASGGGGNVYALLAKFPAAFAAGVVLCGVSDYAMWYRGDIVGEFRDEMDVWIGAGPDEHPEAYRARSGLHLLANVQAPLLIIHGDEDMRVPLAHTRFYQRRAEDLGKKVQVREIPYAGHDLKLARYLDDIVAFLQQCRQPPELPQSGVWCIGGYLQTARQRLELPSLHDFVEVRYSLDADGRIAGLAPIGKDPLPPINIIDL
jgi:dipeptidyl aminopeptidase/acylaminoacyl peptidase